MYGHAAPESRIEIGIGLEVAFAQPQRDAAVEHRRPADALDDAERRRSCRGVAPPAMLVRRFGRVRGREREESVRAPVVGAARHAIAALDHQHALPRPHRRQRRHGAAEAGTDDDQIEEFQI